MGFISSTDETSDSQYAELSSATYYSFLRAGSSPEEMMKAAAELGLSAIAVTDYHGVYGMPKMWGALVNLQDEREEAARRGREAGAEIEGGLSPLPKLLVGASLPLGDRGFRVNFIARTRAAYGSMCRIFTEAHRHAPKGTSLLSVEAFLELMCSLPATNDLFLFPQWEEEWEEGRATFNDLKRELAWISEFPKEQIFIPLSRVIDGRDEERTRIADALALHFKRDLVAHNRVLYHLPERRRAQDTLTCIRESVTLKNSGFKLKRNEEAYLKDPHTMQSLFRDRPDLIARGLEIAKACSFLPSELTYRYPSEWLPEGETSQSHLESLCRKGLAIKYPSGIPKATEDMLVHELTLISQMNYADYFLTVEHIVAFARSKDILCQGRGSAANSVVCYALGVTAIDPIEMGFLFERFISTERGEPPDIDVDFEHSRREEVLQYVYKTYGRDRAAMVSAVSTYRSRSALRETAKVFGVDVGTLSARKVGRMMEDPDQVAPELASRVIKIASEIEDFPRHLSIHSGGFTLSADPITEIVPVEPASMEGRTIIQWDKYDLDILGLLKVDLLSLGMLTALAKGLKMVGKELYEIKSTDSAVYRMISRSDTIGTFQVESRAQMAMLPRLKPKCFYDLVVQVALVRPGPMVGGMVHPYLKRRSGEEEWKADLHPKLHDILGKTYGVPIFQEQVMKMAIVIAGFTPGEADQLRKAIGAWRSSGSIDVMGRKLKEGLKKEGISEEFSERIFQQIQGFAEYGFPESHAASFALLAYVSCWLKYYHPDVFLVSMLNSQPLGFYAPHSLVDDAKRNHVPVLPVSILYSSWDSTLEPIPGNIYGEKAVRLGFHQLNGMNEKEWKRIERVRIEKPFQGFQDFISRSFSGDEGKRAIRRNVLRMMAVGDVFRDFGLNQREALWKVLSIEATEWTPLFISDSVQKELFSETKLDPLSDYESVLSDYHATGMSARGHPMEWVRKRARGKIPDIDTLRAKQNPHGTKISIPGLSLVLQRPPTAKGTAFATLEDECGLLDLVLHKDVFESVRNTMMEEPFVIVTGIIQRNGLAVSLVVKSVRTFIDPSDEEMSIRFEPEVDSLTQVRIPDAPGALARRY